MFMAKGNKKSSKEEMVLKVEQAVGLRLAGFSYEQIGKAMGHETSWAWRLVKKAIDKAEEKAVEDAALLRAIEMQRLDRMRVAIWDKVKNGDLGAIDRALKISDRVAKLKGLDAPEQHEHGVFPMEPPALTISAESAEDYEARRGIDAPPKVRLVGETSDDS